MKNAAILVIVITLFAKVSGFLRDIVLTYYYGTSEISDAYLVALTIPMTLFAYISISISTALITIISSIKSVENKNQNYFVENFVNEVMS